jgi:lysozyme
MQISQAVIDLIKDFEGCSLIAYQDVGDLWTIGYGHTAGVCEGMTITLTQAEQMLVDDLVQYGDYVTNYVTVPLQQHQFDALVSFTYNLGPGTLRHSDLLSFLNAGQSSRAGDAFLEYDHADGVVVPGLARRREAERKLFLSEEKLGWGDRILRWLTGI